MKCTNQQRREILSVKLDPQLLKKKKEKKGSSLTGYTIGKVRFTSVFVSIFTVL